MNIATKSLLVTIFLLTSFYASAQYGSYDLSTLKYVIEYKSGPEKASAQNELATRYKSGTGGVEKDLAKAFYWFKESAQNGDKYAMYNLAMCYRNGQGVGKNSSQAISWMEKSAQLYCPEASEQIGVIYYLGKEVAMDRSKGVRYMKDAAFAGRVGSMVMLTDAYVFGKGVKADANFAHYWARKAIDNKEYICYCMLGNMYEDGRIVKKDLARAWFYYSQGSDYNENHCLYHIARMYEDGIYAVQSYSLAAEYYQKAADAGNGAAMNSLAYLYADGKGVPQDYYKAISILNKAIDLYPDDPDYLDSQGEIYMKKGDYKAAHIVWNSINRRFPSYYSDYVKNNSDDTPLNIYMKAHPELSTSQQSTSSQQTTSITNQRESSSKGTIKTVTSRDVQIKVKETARLKVSGESIKKWESDKESIVTVSSDGIIKGKSAGRTNVWAHKKNGGVILFKVVVTN